MSGCGLPPLRRKGNRRSPSTGSGQAFGFASRDETARGFAQDDSSHVDDSSYVDDGFHICVYLALTCAGYAGTAACN
jgi:hypothetical protein